MVCQDTKVGQFFADFCNFSGQLWYLFFSGKRAIIINKKHRNKTKKNEEEKSMRLWKKVSAMVAMAAVCMTMAVPAVASAEVDARGGCPEHEWKYGKEKRVVSVHTHAYEGGQCQRTEYAVYHYKYCNDCGLTYLEEITTEITHSECGAVE